MFNQLPQDAQVALEWGWSEYQPYFDNLVERTLAADTIEAWLMDESRLSNLISEVSNRLEVAVTCDTTDEAIEQRFLNFIEHVVPQIKHATNALNQKLVASGLEPEGLAVPLRNIRADVEIFREENIPLETDIRKLGTDYDKIKGAQTVQWKGEERTLQQMSVVYLDKDRATREKAFNALHNRAMQDRQSLNELWAKMFPLRQQIAQNAGFASFRDFQWQAMGRFDYTPEDTLRFHAAIEEVVVPVAKRLYDKRRQKLGLSSLRPWDLDVETSAADSLKPFEHVDTLIDTSISMFTQVNSELGAYVDTMKREGLLDLDNRKGKAPGGYCTYFATSKRPFIFMNAVGLHDDVQTMLHEAGHAFHAFEGSHLPYSYQANPPMEFCEVASMAMELLAAPYLSRDKGGFYTASEAARARIEHLTGVILFWPYMAVVDAFQHWAYSAGAAGMDSAACDAKWTELYERYMQGIDFSGLEDWVATGWQRKLHIYQIPFYYIEYGLAQLGAVQVWANSLQDQQAALLQYRSALALGGTAKLPDLFAKAGAKLAFDAKTLGDAVSLMESTLNELEAQAAQ